MTFKIERQKPYIHLMILISWLHKVSALRKLNCKLKFSTALLKIRCWWKVILFTRCFSNFHCSCCHQLLSLVPRKSGFIFGRAVIIQNCFMVFLYLSFSWEYLTLWSMALKKKSLFSFSYCPGTISGMGREKVDQGIAFDLWKCEQVWTPPINSSLCQMSFKGSSLFQEKEK